MWPALTREYRPEPAARPGLGCARVNSAAPPAEGVVAGTELQVFIRLAESERMLDRHAQHEVILAASGCNGWSLEGGHRPGRDAQVAAAGRHRAVSTSDRAGGRAGIGVV